MNSQMIVTIKEQISFVIGTGTAATAILTDDFIVNSTPIIKYIGLCLGTVLSLIMVVYWVVKAIRYIGKVK